MNWGPDAFYMNWGPYLFYVFPPFSVIVKCFQKITQDMATGMLAAPLLPVQTWFTLMLNLLMDKPIILPQSNTLLTQPHDGDLHLLRHQLRPLACKVSGNVSNGEEFHKRLLLSSFSQGLLVPKSNTNRTFPSATDLVLNGKLINAIRL